MEARYPSLSES